MSERKINSYYKKFSKYDETGRQYSFSLYYGFDEDGIENMQPLINYKDEDISAELFRKMIEDVKNEYDADYIHIEEYKGISPNAKPIHEETIRLKEETQVSIARPRSMHELDKEFSGFGGFDGYMNTQRILLKNDYELMVLASEKKELERKFAEIKEDRDRLLQENSQLWEKGRELKAECERLQKYSPDNFNFMGVNPIPIAGAILERGIKNLAIKHPKTVMSLTGLTEQQFAGFISEINGENQATGEIPQQTPQHPVQQAQSVQPVESDKILTPEQQIHLEVCNAVYEWLKSLSSGDLKKVHLFFNYIYLTNAQINEQNMNHLLEIINYSSGKPTED